MRRLLLSCCFLLLLATAAAATQIVPVPLNNGRLQVHDLNAALCDALHLPGCPVRQEVELNSPGGADFLFAVSACLGDGLALHRSGNSLELLVEPNRLPGKCDAARRMTRVFVAEMCPQATAAQARNWGLLVPSAIDPGKPLVVLLHGLDADRCDCFPIGQLLQQAGYQVAYFGYPGDQPIADSAALLARELGNLHQHQPTLRIDLVGHSMGGLVARQYLEGENYSGGVDRLIMVAPPNAGSSWARARFLLSVAENYHLHRDNPQWHWTWVVTEGLGEAGSDLLPGSEFLRQLNARPRRAGVRYTIIAGNKSGVSRAEADLVEKLADIFPTRTRHWWGLRWCYGGLHGAAGRLRDETSDGDGPVSLCSAKLEGVSDFVVLPADHIALYLPSDANPPAAFSTIRERLCTQNRSP